MFKREKFKALLHHAIARVEDPSRLGAVKLNKIAWFSDAHKYLTTGESITGARFIKKPQGPVPKALIPVMQELQDEDTVMIETVNYYGKGKRQFRSMRDPDDSVFTPEEIATINRITDAIANSHTAKTISDATHGAAWKLAEDGEDLPFHAYLADEFQVATPADIAWATDRMKAAEQQAA